jgi:BTB/POZ domain-containing protein 9
VNHISLLSDNLNGLYLSETFSDITLVVDGNRLPAHRVLLAARSDYFRALLYGGMKESQETDIHIKVSSLQAFKYLLKYLYCGHIQLKSFKEETILEIFGLSHEYGFVELEEAISEYLKNTLSIRNVRNIRYGEPLPVVPIGRCLSDIHRQTGAGSNQKRVFLLSVGLYSQRNDK